MAFRVEQTARAKTDLDTILEWLIEQGAGEPGLRWFRKLREAIASLSELPHRCPLAPKMQSFLLRCGNSFMAAKPHRYRILFTIDGEIVVVLHIRHGRRQHLSDYI